jgi:hypothetical protein
MMRRAKGCRRARLRLRRKGQVGSTQIHSGYGSAYARGEAPSTRGVGHSLSHAEPRRRSDTHRHDEKRRGYEVPSGGSPAPTASQRGYLAGHEGARIIRRPRCPELETPFHVCPRPAARRQLWCWQRAHPGTWSSPAEGNPPSYLELRYAGCLGGMLQADVLRSASQTPFHRAP